MREEGRGGGRGRGRGESLLLRVRCTAAILAKLVINNADYQVLHYP